MGIFKLFKNYREKLEFEDFILNASDEELSEAYEESRQEWLRLSGGRRTDKMIMLSKELSRRSAEAWENDPRRSKDPNFHWTDKNRWEKD